MNKYAILSTDNNPDYYSLLPLVCRSWQRIGYTPKVISVNLPENILQLLSTYCPDVYFIPQESVEGVKDSTIAQLLRLWPLMPNSDDVIVTADADMVIARDIFTHDVSHGRVVSYGFDLTGRSEIPICYVAARADKWRELMGEFTIPEKAYSERWEDYWSVDQQLLTQRAREYGMNRITFVDRGNQNKHGLPTGRWDRHDWAHIPDSIIDVHMPRNDWQAQIQVAERLWPGEDHSFITKFREALEGGPYGTELKEPINLSDIQEPMIDPHYLLQELPKWDERGNNFLGSVTGNWNNHLPLLILGLQLSKRGTTGIDVLELGSGEGSTPLLRQYCKDQQLKFHSFDNNKEWCDKTGAQYVDNWDILIDEALTRRHGLIFIDHAPGERRHLDAIRLANAADILVLHDTEEGGAGNYMWSKAWPHFKYRLNYNKTGGGAGATAVSNKIDLNRFRGLSLGAYKFDID
jgi:hypothetical protein